MRQDELSEYAREYSDRPPRIYGVDEAIVIELHGDIDLVAYQDSVGLVDTATGGREPLVIVDLSKVDFVDCSGLSLVMRAHRRVTARGGRLRVVCAHPLTLRMLRVTRLSAALSPAPTLAEALREPDGDRRG